MFEVHSGASSTDRKLARLKAARAMERLAALFYKQGWAYGTCGNYSAVLQRDPIRLLITASGRDKRELTEDDFVLVDADGVPTDPDCARPSAETLLHTMLVEHTDAGAVLHVHSVWNTLLSDRFFADGFVRISGYEMLKGLAGITTHEAEVRIPIFDNTQDIPLLAEQVRRRLLDQPEEMPHAFLIRGHGVYCWGHDLAEARRHVEIVEFLFEVTGRGMMLEGGKRT